MDQHHVQISASGMSCGVLELSRIESDSDKVLFAMASYLYHPSRGQPAAYFVWSDIEGPSNGGKLFHKICESSSVFVVGPTENPKTSNPILVYIWTIPHESFKEWYKAERIKRVQAS